MELFYPCERRTLLESELNSYCGAKFSLGFAGNYKKPSMQKVPGCSHGQNCCNTFVYNVLRANGIVLFHAKAYFIRNDVNSYCRAKISLSFTGNYKEPSM